MFSSNSLMRAPLDCVELIGDEDTNASIGLSKTKTRSIQNKINAITHYIDALDAQQYTHRQRFIIIHCNIIVSIPRR